MRELSVIEALHLAVLKHNGQLVRHFVLPTAHDLPELPVPLPTLHLVPEPAHESSLVMGFPVPGHAGSVFGMRWHPTLHKWRMHQGVDLPARDGDPVHATGAGTVVTASWHQGYGNLVVIDHGGGMSTAYAHLSAFDVGVGQHVKAGDTIGAAGHTGNATGPHVHYEVRKGGVAVDPVA